MNSSCDASSGYRKEYGYFFRDIAFNFGSSELKESDISQYGYLTWETVEKFCKLIKMTNTLENFEHNRGKIY